ncbi:MAG TPA: LamG-like jellyroll fold domain-containing protein, partial [Candidatus Binatia bacterium]|nr:LamG-like jellyroll fold domain-containing protein [Candidatus Binatia bacterium]
NATLTVLPNVASVSQTLFPSVFGARDNYSGLLGGIFLIGSSPALVTHLGYYCTNGQSLNQNHHVGIFSLTDGTVPLASVLVPAGPQTNIVDNYSYIPLDTPVVLAANTPYILSGEVSTSSGDPWPDLFVPTPWNSYYVGGNAGGTRAALYSGGADVWPLAPYNLNGVNNLYGPGNLALLPQGSPVVLMQQSHIYQYATSNTTFSAVVNGLAPLTLQWYKTGSPDTPLSGQTATTLTLANLALGDSGTYYLVGNNPQGSGTNSVVLTVLAAGPPTISQPPQSQTAYLNQQVPFTVSTLTSPVTYQWMHAGTNLPGANAGTYTTTAGPSTTGNYLVVVANNYGSATSAVATLTLQSGAAAAALLAENPLVYYGFSDVGVSATTPNFGNLGPGFAGMYEGNTNAAAGPQPPAWPNFETNNLALLLDGASVDVSIPALNLPTNTGPNLTLAAWINSQNSDTVLNQYGGIIFNRPLGIPGATASGLDIQYDSGTGSFMLGYHWNSQYFGYPSHLDIPLGQWVFVAMAVDPAKAVFYLNDGTGMKTATNVAAHAAVPFVGTTFVGWDANDATQGKTVSRRFNGAIDEPMIFGRTLSPNEITALYQAGVGPVQLQISLVAGNVVLIWPRGVLQQSGQAGSGYADTAFTSPYTNSPVGMTFYRVRIP